MDQLVVAEGVHRHYAAGDIVTRALDGVDIELARGEFVSIMGPSGCGKSTLLNVLSGLDRLTAGSISFDGRRVDGLNEREWAKLRQRHIGFVFQYFNLVSDLSVRDNVELPCVLSRRRSSAVRERVDALLEELGLASKAAMMPARLSGGERQRVALARALVNEPELIAADEPTGSLDSQNAVTVMDLLKRAHLAGHTILLVTHEPRIATRAERLLTMRDGRIVDQTSLAQTPGAPIDQLLELGS